MKRSGFKPKARKPLKRTPIRAKTRLESTTAPHKGIRKAKAKKPKVTLIKRKLWDECRRIIRARHGNTCYTCGHGGLEGSNWQTGHFISSSICSVYMRYHLDNLRPQCYNCNINKSGNWIAFEAHLILDFGKDFPEQLKQINRDTTGKQYDILYYQDKLEEYKKL